MDTVKILFKQFLVLKIVRMQTAGMEPYPGERGPSKGMDCMNVTVGRLLVGKTPPAALHQAIIVIGGGTSFHPFEVLMVRVQVQGDVLPLNEISEIPLIPLGDRMLSWEQPGHRDQTPISYPHWWIMTHTLKVGGWRANFIEFPLRATLGVIPHLSFKFWVCVTGYEAVGW